MRHLALTLCWTQPAAVLAQVDEAEQLNRDLKLQPGIGQCLVARAVALAGRSPLAEVDALLAEADGVFNDAGYVDDALAAVAAGVFVAAVSGDDGLARERRSALVDRAQGRRPRSWLAIADAWTGENSRFDAVTWPQGRDNAYATWHETMRARRAGRPGSS